jgi:ribosomal protein L21E
MKNMKEIFESTLSERWQVGDNIAFNLDDVAKANPGKQVQDDSGVVLKVTGKGYLVKLHLDGTEVTVPERSAIMTGDAGDDNQTP